MSLAAREHSLKEAISHKTAEMWNILADVGPRLQRCHDLNAEVENLLVQLEDLKMERTAEDRRKER